MTIERTILRSCVAALWLLTPVFAQGATVLDFDDLGNFDNVFTYYDGGFNNAGMQGPDYGIRVTSGSPLSLRSMGNTYVSFDRGQSGPIVFTVQDGFTNGFALRFASVALADVDVLVFIVDANNQVLANARVPLEGNPDYLNGLNWFTLGLEFDGVAHRVFVSEDGPFEGFFVGVDNLTFGQSTLVPVPGALWLFGGALAGLAGFGQRRVRS